ncbi:MAG: M20 family metallopeptidase [Chloroflexota bacterium]|nr:M20 family metallopeptidase [Chloroflexota bacterium]
MSDTAGGREPARATAAPELLDAARALLPDMVATRRAIHRRPEIGLALPETQRAVAERLEELGLAPALGRSVGSVTAIIEGQRPGPTMLLRADMDALPLQEDTGLDFASEVPGVMHACGHDTHVAMLLGAAQILTERREALAGGVLLMFQPGEEGYHGARFMLEEGLLDVGEKSPVTGAFAIHIGNRYENGTINFRSGPQMASGDTIRITVRGRGGHASAPHLAVDPITVAAHIVVALQTMVTRTVDAFDPAVITIANISAGTTTNVIPETAFMQGTMRTVSAAQRAAVKERLPGFVAAIAGAFGATAELELEPGYPVTSNDAAVCELVGQDAAALIGPDQVRSMPAPIMGSEDFSYVLEKVPGAMVFLGAAPKGVDPQTVPQNHSNKVVFDEPTMAVGAALYAAVALRHLAPG